MTSSQRLVFVSTAETHPIIEFLYMAGFSSERARILFCPWSCSLASVTRPIMSRQFRPLLPATGGQKQQESPPERRRRNVACEQCRVKKTRVRRNCCCPRIFQCADNGFSSVMACIRSAGGVKAYTSYASMRLGRLTRVVRLYCKDDWESSRKKGMIYATS